MVHEGDSAIRGNLWDRQKRKRNLRELKALSIFWPRSTNHMSDDLERIEAALQRIEAALQRIEASSKNMDRHISFVERVMNPFRAVGGLMRLR